MLRADLYGSAGHIGRLLALKALGRTQWKPTPGCLNDFVGVGGEAKCDDRAVNGPED
jgi:hypothetical protein